MASHTDSCGMFVIDPFDIEADCCLDVAEPVRPHQDVEMNVTLTNHEQSRVEGDLDFVLKDTRNDTVISELDGLTAHFSLEAGETDGYSVTFQPDDYNVDRTHIDEFDGEVMASVGYALENVRAPDEHDE